MSEAEALRGGRVIRRYRRRIRLLGDRLDITSTPSGLPTRALPVGHKSSVPKNTLRQCGDVDSGAASAVRRRPQRSCVCSEVRQWGRKVAAIRGKAKTDTTRPPYV
ncbi:hypothetical protein SKAU_G00202000 [Synaphobranchus kaupii]|uniref:Uncharacterized protein n=1 Tax=Synaphobranchus kaupii TaxID=118154 RepID=A0A9Q1FFL5_SYNKA|nr:hypothetical protein SKAU_G00202000 [Synaphobranchus kaupii]